MIQSLFLYFGSFTYITEHTLVLRILYLYYETYSCISDTEVPVGTTGLILILQNLYLIY